MTEHLHLQPRHKLQLETLLQQYLPGVEVWAYGSRIKGSSHEGSDLDLVLRSANLSPIDSTQLDAFKEALQESNIPIIVEARDWAMLPESFHVEIEGDHVVLVKERGRS